PMLQNFQERLPDACRNIDSDEAIGREDIILAALVNDAEVAILLGVLVGQGDIDFVSLEGGLIAAVVHTDSELATRHAGLLRPSRGTSCACTLSCRCRLL